MKPIRALISVYDKENIVELAKFLSSQNIEIISTGGTFDLLYKNGINCIEVSEFTKSPEILSGRVKTLNSKIHGGILSKSDNPTHQKDLADNDISQIDIVIVNLYPFEQVLADPKSTQNDIIENIDIGGPTMIRAAAKNYKYKLVICDKVDYLGFMEEMHSNNGEIGANFRKKMAKKAFGLIANYDIAIANWFGADIVGINTEKAEHLRYGENPHQNGYFYRTQHCLAQIHGKELSYNNINDMDAAIGITMEFDEPTCVIVKHTNPCGVAIAENINQAYAKALKSDQKSAFGGIVALNREIDTELASLMSEMFFEVIIAPEVSESALEILQKKKNLRIIIVNYKFIDKSLLVKSVIGGYLLQNWDDAKIEIESCNIKPEAKFINEMVFAMKICKFVKSNAIVISANGQIVAISSGQTSRVDAVKIACEKAEKFAQENGIAKSEMVLASDAFFPFADNVELIAEAGIKYAIATSGSVRDSEVLEAANKYGISLSFIKTRHFKH